MKFILFDLAAHTSTTFNDAHELDNFLCHYREYEYDIYDDAVVDDFNLWLGSDVDSTIFALDRNDVNNIWPVLQRVWSIE